MGAIKILRNNLETGKLTKKSCRYRVDINIKNNNFSTINNHASLTGRWKMLSDNLIPSTANYIRVGF